MEDNDLAQLRSEWKTLKRRDRRSLEKLAISGRPAEDDRSRRMFSFIGRRYLRQEFLRMAVHAAAGRFLLGAIIIISLEPGVTLNLFKEFSFPRLFVWILVLVWVLIAASFVPMGRVMRKAANATNASEQKPGNNTEPRPPLSRPAAAIIAGELVLSLAVVLLSIFVRDFSAIWVAYFAAEALLLAMTVRVARSRPVQ